MTTDADTPLGRALEIHSDGRLAEADAALRAIPRADASYVEAVGWRAVIAAQQGFPNDAASLLDDAARAASADVFVRGGVELASRSHPEAALATFDRAWALRPDDPILLTNRATVLLQLSRPDDALKCVEAALVWDLLLPGAHHHLGTTLMTLWRAALALEAFDQAIALRDDVAALHLGRGDALTAMHRFSEAQGSYDRGLIMLGLPQHAPARDKALALLRLGRPIGAVASFDAVLAVEPENLAVRNARRAALEQELALREAVLATKPKDAIALHAVGSMLMQLERYEEALAVFDRAILRDPKRLGVVTGRAYAHCSRSADRLRHWPA